MRSPLRTLAAVANRAPVPYAGRTQTRFPWWQPTGTEGRLRAMGSVGTLFAIVDRLATSTAAPDWKLYRTARPGQATEEREEVTRHLALDIWRKPNPFFTQALFVETGQQHFDLVGETWWVVARNGRARSIPLELWPVRPDRMEPVPDRDNYLSGYIYTGPDGETVPLRLDEVIQIRRPNPIDPYRGMGPVQTILADLEGVQLSAEWNRNFFANSAEPGGLIKVEKRLGDEEFNEMRDRWNEQHKGVANAHRVAIIENGAEWVDRKFTNKDMQFAELRAVSSDVIREAYGIPKFALGDVTDVNRATADASAAWFASQMTVPRLERIKQALNSQFLPLFGTTGVGVEFDYCSPVAADREADREDMTSAASAAADLIESGFYAPEVLEAVGLPPMSFGQPDADPDRELLIDLVKGAPTLAPLLLPMLGYELPEEALAALKGPAPASPPESEPPTPAEDAPPEPHRPPAPQARAVSVFDLARPRPRFTAAAEPEPEPEREREDVDLAGVRDDLEDALDALMDTWDTDVAPGQIDALAEQVETAIDGGDLDALGELTVDTGTAAAVLRDALAAMATTAAERMAREAAAQGVDVTVPRLDESLTNSSSRVPLMINFGAELFDVAVATATLLAGDLAATAGREALRLFKPGTDGTTIAGRVRGLLSGLKGAVRRAVLGGALHRATNLGRLATLEAAPAATYICTEVNDRNRCKPCSDLDGTEFDDMAAAWATYAGGAYAECEGGDRCRGTVTARWETRR